MTCGGLRHPRHPPPLAGPRAAAPGPNRSDGNPMPPGQPGTPGQPASARIHNALLGGWNHTCADAAAADAIEDACPQARQICRDSRLFTARVTAYAAGLGITQYIELGAGLAPAPSVADTARSLLDGAARVAYVDWDQDVTEYLAYAAPGAGTDGIAVVQADLSDPAAVMTDPGLLKVIDPARPACLLACLVLHFRPPAEAEAIIAGYAARLAPGSLVAICIPRVDDEVMWARMGRVRPDAAWNYTAQDVAAVLGGLDLVPPGVGAVFGLHPGWDGVPERRREGGYTLGAIARIPLRR